jgi:hypothetical protein
MSDEYTAKYDPEWEVHDVLCGDKIVVGFVQGTATTNEIVGELNRLSADNKRLRDALVDAANALGAWGIMQVFTGCPKPVLHDAAWTKAQNAAKHHTG